MKQNDEHDIEITKALSRQGFTDVKEGPDVEAMQDAWFLAGLAAENNLDAHAALEKVHQKMKARNPSKTFKLTAWKVAASLSIIIVASFIAYFFLSRAPVKIEQLYHTSTEKSGYKLPDGSDVMMNKLSELDYKQGQAAREVALKGEAFFEVRHDPEHPFIVTTSNARIEVVGTRFNVKAYPDQPTVVTVAEGKVKVVMLANEESVLLNKGDQVTAKPGSGEGEASLQEEEVLDANYLAWKTGLLEFKDSNLKQVTERLEELYHVSIKFEDNLSQCKITAKFKNRDLDFIFSVLEATLNVKVEKEDKEYTLTGTGCK